MDSQTRRFTYPLWLRFFTLVAGVAMGVLLAGPSILFSSSDPLLPWNEEFRIVPPDQTSEIKPSDKQPQLTSVLRYKTQPKQDGSPRGTINFLICPDGTVKGVWNGEYDRPADSAADQSDDVHCLIMAASFAGNVDPSKPFIENGSRSFSNLYFIARGSFTLFETERSTGRGRNVLGLIYVRGWLYPDYTAVGEVVITENKRSFDTFDWVAQPAD